MTMHNSKRSSALLAGLLLAATASLPAVAEPSALSIAIAPSAANAASPQMGDRLAFETVIRNTGDQSIDGLIAWISLVQIDPGKEQPIDLEDWSAHKAISRASLKPGETISTQWPMRLIQSGHYRVVVSAVSREGASLTPSPFVDFVVRAKPVVESARVLPVALGLPLLIGLSFIGWRRRDRDAG
ncbi:MAG: hypothetical protein ACRDBL_01235 [Rhabdaerophilum sp.]